jgi:hypothetical protein
VLPTSGQPWRRIPVARGEKSDFESDEDGSIPSTGAMKKSEEHFHTIVPERLRSKIEENPELWKEVNQIIADLHSDMMDGVAKMGRPIDEVCALIMWDDVDPRAPQRLTMALFTHEHYESVKCMFVEDGVFAKGLQDLVNEDAQGFMRVLVVTRSGNAIRLRAGSQPMSKGGQA